MPVFELLQRSKALCRARKSLAAAAQVAWQAMQTWLGSTHAESNTSAFLYVRVGSRSTLAVGAPSVGLPFGSSHRSADASAPPPLRTPNRVQVRPDTSQELKYFRQLSHTAPSRSNLTDCSQVRPARFRPSSSLAKTRGSANGNANPSLSSAKSGSRT